MSVYFNLPKRDPVTTVLVFRLWVGLIIVWLSWHLIKDIWRLTKIIRAKPKIEIVGMEDGRPVVEKSITIDGVRKVLERVKC